METEKYIPLGPVEEYDPDENRIIAESVRRGSEEAIRQTLAAGVPVTIIRGNDIVEIHPDGSEKIVGVLAR